MERVRTSVLLLALLPALLLACDDDDDPSAPESTATGEESSSLVFRTIVKIDGINWFNRLGEGVTRFAEETGVEVSVVGPAEADAAQQIPLIEAAIDDAVDAICAVPVDPAQLDPV